MTLAFDHARIIETARARLQEHLNDPRRTAPFEIVPPRFTLMELQRVYEAVLGRALDKRNFRARVTARALVEAVAAQQKTGRHRPAQLYRWKRGLPKRGREKKE
jgi:8-oxo-dGTP diphosphatase